MALIYRAQLIPSKLEVLAAWIPAQPWIGDADAAGIEALGAYRFDDPDGAVGIETHLLRSADGQVLQVPLTYRGAPLAGAESALIATLQHSVLGERWVYDACADPVYLQALSTVVLTGGCGAELDYVTDAGHERRKAETKVSGSGSSGSPMPSLGAVTYTSEGTTTVIRTSDVEAVLLRVIGPDHTTGGPCLTGTWPGRDAPALLARVRLG
jgi:hypothetical protein